MLASGYAAFSSRRLVLFASPPALRSEFVRRAFSSTTCLLAPPPPRGLCNSPTPRYRIDKSLARTKREATTRQIRQQASTSTSHPPISPTQDDSTTSPPRPRRLRRALLTSTLTLLFTLTGFAMAAAPATNTINGFVNPPTDAETLDLYTPSTPHEHEINTHILTHPLAVSLRSRKDMYESRPHLKIPESMRPHNLTGGTLMGGNRIAVPPLIFADKDAELPTLTSISYLGPALCGHPGIVHGGLLATLLDEGLARACFPALPNKVGVTASLKIDYRVPCPAESFVVLKAFTTKVEGRKAWVKGWIEVLGEEGEAEGKRLVEAEALFVEPKNAASMARVYSTQ
ncbi:hypothetical protein B0A50_06101 [Salinomyces thailandicus]|uniref:Thioesterase domain-containing protein n=1 Tax=Salinomyces thailandicus TaxID=706561 RepID=A0A4U0TS28_9PEZI|nr:hypothetical protein B0A50_06101 [Salinomyces thailandica]